jgi:hypothetical protein
MAIPFNSSNTIKTIKLEQETNAPLVSYIPSSNTMSNFNVLNHWIMVGYLQLALLLYRYVDKGIIEYLGPLSISRFIHWVGFQIEMFATGFIPHLAFILIFSVFITLILFT